MADTSDTGSPTHKLSYGSQPSRFRYLWKPRLILTIAVLSACIWWVVAYGYPQYQISSSLSECESHVFPDNSIGMQMHHNGSSTLLSAELPMVPQAWLNVAELVDRVPEYSTIYLHGRSNAQGQRIVVVEASTKHYSGTILRCTVLKREGWFGATVCRSMMEFRPPILDAPCSWWMLFRGTSHPDDSSRFRIRYDSSHGFGLIEGILNADDSVQFTSKAG